MIKGYAYPQEKNAFYKGFCNQIIVFKYRSVPNTKQIILDDSKLDVIDKISFWLVRRK